MSPTEKPKPMSDVSFRFMIWAFKLNDLFFSPERFLEKVPLKKEMMVVDYACGPGRYTIPVAELVGPKGKVYAVDIQPLAIKTVKEKAAARSLSNVETVLVDAYNTGIPGSTADVVLFIDAIQSISDTDGLFREINRLLKPGGLLFLEPGHWKPSRVREVVEQSGLFHMVKFDGRNMLLAKKGSERDSRK